jgi:hypothetical protein
MEVLKNPMVRVFTTFLLSLLIVSPFIQNIYEYSDGTTKVLYFLIAAYVLIRDIYVVTRDTRNLNRKP